MRTSHTHSVGLTPIHCTPGRREVGSQLGERLVDRGQGTQRLQQRDELRHVGPGLGRPGNSRSEQSPRRSTIASRNRRTCEYELHDVRSMSSVRLRDSPALTSRRGHRVVVESRLEILGDQCRRYPGEVPVTGRRMFFGHPVGIEADW